MAEPVLRIDRSTREVRVDGDRVRLTRKEYALLVALAERPSAVFTKDRLLRQVWEYQCPGRTRTVDAHACRLRRALGNERFILNERGLGYRLVDAGDEGLVAVGSAFAADPSLPELVPVLGGSQEADDLFTEIELTTGTRVFARGGAALVERQLEEGRLQVARPGAINSVQRVELGTFRRAPLVNRAHVVALIEWQAADVRVLSATRVTR